MIHTPATTPPAYQGPDYGPFRCDHCEYANQTATRCRKPQVVTERKGQIAPGGCCNFFERDATVRHHGAQTTTEA